MAKAQKPGGQGSKPGAKSAPGHESRTATGILAAAFRRAVLRRQEAEQQLIEGPAGPPTKEPAKPTKRTPARDRPGRGKRRGPRKKRAKASPVAARKKAARAAVKATDPALSPLAPSAFPALPALPGVTLGAAAAGIRYKGRNDVMVAALAPGTTVAGVFTTSRMPGAPIDWAKLNLAAGGKSGPTARALVVNAGNANVFTGKAGAEAVEKTANAAAKLGRCKPREVFVASTGVIGEPLPVAKIEAALPKLWPGLKDAAGAWRVAAEAIMTTDTFAKGATRQATIAGTPVTINGIAKGSGMIAPDLATMLAFVFTDAALPASVLQTLLVLGVRDTFNATTVDSDTSTSDMVLLFATGQGEKHDAITRAGDPRLRAFRVALHDLMADLARQVVRDGEGASKFITVTVTGAASAKAARAIALSIANSPLVKTAVAAGDANWGRVVMAVGKAGEQADRDKLAIRMAGLPVAERGARSPAHDEARLSNAMRSSEIGIEVDVGVGTGRATIWTCDLTHDYVTINGAYRS